MKKGLKVLVASAEVVPFAKTGGLADVAGALPLALKELGCDVRVIMPKYKAISDEVYNLKVVARLQFPIGNVPKLCVLKVGYFPKTEVPVYFLENEEYYGRSIDNKSLYVDPATAKPYPDNDERFIFFCRGILEALPELEWTPDVIHCNDYHTALVPLYLRTLYANKEQFTDTATIFSIHNMAYQGTFEKEAVLLAGLPPQMFYPLSPIEFWGKFNFMKAGLAYANIINTVSEKYAREIQTPEYGSGLEGVLVSRSEDLYGILNGVDYDIWNPEKDTFIKANYSVEDIENKKKCKRELQKDFDLTVRKKDSPLLGIVSRLDEQKGFDLLEKVMPEVIKMDLQLVLLGTGKKEYEELFTKFNQENPKQIGVRIGFDNALAHKIEAGCDIFLMPSRYEPCGLNQMYSLKYGTVPVVRATGGLADTIKEYDSTTGEGNGFVFEKYDSDEFLAAIKRAVELYANKETWEKIMKNGMQQDFSWKASAKKYMGLYEKAVDKKKLVAIKK